MHPLFIFFDNSWCVYLEGIEVAKGKETKQQWTVELAKNQTGYKVKHKKLR